MTSNPYQQWEDVLDADWSSAQERAWQVFRKAEDGDEVMWGDRKAALTVNERRQTDGLVELEVEGPRGGSYTLRERYDMGEPAYYADDSKANDLRFDDDTENGDARLSSNEYQDLTDRLETQALNLYSTGDYASYEDAVRSVVDEWATEVQFARVDGMRSQQDRYPIFRSVIDQTPQLESDYEGPPQRKAEEMLVDAIVERSREDADLSLVRDPDSYRDFVDTVASGAMDRIQSNRYESASTASRDATINALDGRSDEFYSNIIRFSDRDPMEYDYYIDVEEEQQYQEMALDVLWDDVREEVRRIRRERGEHDPRPAGLRHNQYDGLVEHLVEETIREHRINENALVRTTAEDLAEGWADQVESGTWSMDGQDFEPIDSDDIFGSVVLHSRYEPSGFRPFSDDAYRDNAVEVLTEDVTKRYETAVDDDRDAHPIPADEYLDDVLGLDITYNDIREDQDLTAKEYVRGAVQGYDGDWDLLAGWTFIDELVEVGGFNVPKLSNEWILVDYGLVETDDRLRRAAWFHRRSGDVLGLTGITSNPPSEGGYSYEDFGVYRMRWNDPEPEYLISDVPIQEAMDLIYDYIGGNTNDLRLVETREGEYYVQDALDEGKIDGGSLIANLMPDWDVPGTGFIPERARRGSGRAFERVTRIANEKLQLQADARKYAILVFLEMSPYLLNKIAYGLEIAPTYHREKGAGLNFQTDIGMETNEGVGGEFEGTLYVRPDTLRSFGSAVVPEQLWTLGDSTVDVTLVDQKIDEMVDAVGTRTAKARALYLLFYLPTPARGAPQQITQWSLHYKIEQGDTATPTEGNPWYTLLPGETLDEEELKRRIKFAHEHGVGSVYLDDSRRQDDGTFRLGTVEGLRDDDPNKQLPGELAREVGWSLDYQTASEWFGPAEQVGEPRETAPIASYETFLELYDAFTHVPEKGVATAGFQWLVQEARESDQFTLADAYDAFRLSLVFNETQRKRNDVMEEFIESGEWAPDRILAGSVTETPTRLRTEHDPGGIQYVWSVPTTHPLADVWQGKTFDDDNEHILMDVGKSGYGATHYYQWEGEGERYSYYKNYRNIEGGRERRSGEDLLEYIHGPQKGPAANVEFITGYDDLWEYLSQDAKQDVVDELAGIEWHDGEDLDWEDLDGTGLDIGGLFIQGLDAAGISGQGRFADRNQLFPLRLNDIPGVNFQPERPDIPTFEEWRENRYGPGFDGAVPERAQQRARYLRDVADQWTPRWADLTGTSEEAEFDSQAQRQAAEFSGDYQDYESLYAEEFGESFDDVAMKFNSDGRDIAEPDQPDTDTE